MLTAVQRRRLLPFPVRMRQGERCMKDSVHHPVHRSVHLDAWASVQTRRACGSSGTHFGRGQNTVLGWNDPDLDALPRPIICGRRSSPLFCPRMSVHMVDRFQETGSPKVKKVTNAFCTFRIGTSLPDARLTDLLSRTCNDNPSESHREKKAQIGRERPHFFGFQPPQKFSWSLPPDIAL